MLPDSSISCRRVGASDGNVAAAVAVEVADAGNLVVRRHKLHCIHVIGDEPAIRLPKPVELADSLQRLGELQFGGFSKLSP